MSTDFSFEVESVANGYVLTCTFETGVSVHHPTYCCLSFSDLRARINEILEKLSKEK